MIAFRVQNDNHPPFMPGASFPYFEVASAPFQR